MNNAGILRKENAGVESDQDLVGPASLSSERVDHVAERAGHNVVHVGGGGGAGRDEAVGGAGAGVDEAVEEVEETGEDALDHERPLSSVGGARVRRSRGAVLLSDS